MFQVDGKTSAIDSVFAKQQPAKSWEQPWLLSAGVESSSDAPAHPDGPVGWCACSSRFLSAKHQEISAATVVGGTVVQTAAGGTAQSQTIYPHRAEGTHTLQ